MAANSSLHTLSCNFPLINFLMPTILALLSLMIPLLVYVLVVGFQRWRKQPFSSPFATSTHIDILTYNVAFMDLLGVSGNYFTYFGVYADQLEVLIVGYSMIVVSSIGHPLLQLLTCIERYLAVVHPICYLRLRGSAGVRIRNITIGCVWLSCIGVSSLCVWLEVSFLTLSSVFLFFTTAAFCFCSVSVFWALIRPGPGERGGDNRLSNQSKQRALHTMALITATLLPMLISSLIISVVETVSVLYGYTFCVLACFSVLFLLPTYLVLPLLFLQRVGKLTVCGHKPNETA